MHVIETQNVSEAFVKGLHHLVRNGFSAQSRNGEVMVADEPVSTVYYQPLERVVFHKDRDYNIFFNIYESLWMLSGRNTVRPLTRYVSNFHRYSDDGETLHGAYGYRWRYFFGVDQLRLIIQELRTQPESRRVVLQMWSAQDDLGRRGNDVPCNTMATFQKNPATGKLDMAVFCRSNDAFWGAYFANAFHFSVLLDYVANQTGIRVGTYTQISVNFHFYPATVPQELIEAVRPMNHTWSTYDALMVKPVKIGDQNLLMDGVDEVLDLIDSGGSALALRTSHPFLQKAARLLECHAIFKKDPKDDRLFAFVDSHLNNPTTDWDRSAALWLNRRINA